MFLQSRLVRNLTSGDILRRNSLNPPTQQDGDQARPRPASTPAHALHLSYFAQFVRHIRKKMKKHHVSFYEASTHQKAWTPRPHHVSFSGTMWVDLTIVGVLYRLDEFFLVGALQDVQGFWLPFMILLAIYDAWEVRPFLQAEFRTKGISFVHSVVFLVSWLMLAIMGATIPYKAQYSSSSSSHNSTSSEASPPTLGPFQWTTYDQSVFAYIKLVHAALRVGSYLEVYLFSPSKRAKVAAKPRLVTYSCGTAVLILPPILVAYGIPSQYVVICYLCSFLVQKLVSNAIFFFDLGKMKTKARAAESSARVNMPFIVSRLRDWTQLQLGACLLGLITASDLSVNSFAVGGRYVVVITGYFFLAFLDMYSYASEPPVFTDHAMIAGGIASIMWFDFFILLTLSLLGIAVGLRYVFQFPNLATEQKPSLIWLLAGSSACAILFILLQEINHKSRKVVSTRRRVWFFKAFCACSCLVSPSIILGVQATDESLYWITLNLALATLAVLSIHAINGGFRREVAKKTQIKLKGHLLAVIIARRWLMRARQSLEQQSVIDLEGGRIHPSNLRSRQPRDVILEEDEDGTVVHSTRTYQDGDHPDVFLEGNEEDDDEDEDDINKPRLKKQLIQPFRSGGPRGMLENNNTDEDGNGGPDDDDDNEEEGTRVAAGLSFTADRPMTETTRKQPQENEDVATTAAAPVFSPASSTQFPEVEIIGLNDEDDNTNNTRSSPATSLNLSRRSRPSESGRQRLSLDTPTQSRRGSLNNNNDANWSKRSRNSLNESSRRRFVAVNKVLEAVTSSVRRRVFGGNSNSDIDGSAMAGEKPVAIRVLKKVLNDHLYERPRLLVEQDVFAEYSLSWSDLFLDIIYIGVVYRLGEYFLLGLALKSHGTEELPVVASTVYLFACLFYAVFSLWWCKLAFSSKCGVSDVFHKGLDMLQGLFVVLLALNITYPQEFQVPGAASPFIVTAFLALFHLSMLFLWTEVLFSRKNDVPSIACSHRNMRREYLSLFALFLAFLTCGLKGPIELISTFWGLSWLFPTLERFLTVGMVKSNEKAGFLLRYVLHRLGDGNLILLGEGVFQIIRSVSAAYQGQVFLVFTLCFLNMTAVRVALFEMDCFDEHARKHVVLRSRYGYLAVCFIRALASPAVVCIGVALKMIVSMSDARPHKSSGRLLSNEECGNDLDMNQAVQIYQILASANAISLVSFLAIYHVHRTFYYQGDFRWKHCLMAIGLSLLFFILPWIPCIGLVGMTAGSLAIWCVSIFFHAITDDLFSFGDSVAEPSRVVVKEMEDRETRQAKETVVKEGRHLLKYLSHKDDAFKSSRSLLTDLRHRASSVSSVTKAFLDGVSSSPGAAARTMLSTSSRRRRHLNVPPMDLDSVAMQEEFPTQQQEHVTRTSDENTSLRAEKESTEKTEEEEELSKNTSDVAMI